MSVAMPAPPQSPKLKDYQIHMPPLGEGSYGVVYRATYRGISDRAVKIFKPHKVDLATVARELEKLSSVAEHPGIVTLHDFDLTADAPYYAMGLHAGETSHHTWRGRTLEDLCGRVDAREAWRLISEIADALAYLHRHHIIHCDIKPSNVLLTDESPPRVKICDFGQSRGSGVETFEAAGTPYYAPPEQLRAPHDSTEGSGFKWDVYSFGALAYKLITGKLPRLQDLSELVYDDGDPDATIVDASTEQSIVEGTLAGRINARELADMIEKEPKTVWPGKISRSKTVDIELKAVIEKCLSLDRTKRYSDMRETASALRAITRMKQTRRAHRLVGTFAALSVLAIGATGFAFTQMRNAHRASEAEKKARGDAEELVNFILFDLGEKLKPIGRMELLEHVSSNAETYFSSLAKDQPTARTLQILAGLLNSRGDVAFSQGDYNQAIEHYGKAYNIAFQLLENDVESSKLQTYAAQSLTNMGNVHLAKGHYDEALINYDHALELHRQQIDMAGGDFDPGLRQSVVACLMRIAEVNQQRDDLDSALEHFEEALELMRVTEAEFRAASDKQGSKIPGKPGVGRMPRGGGPPGGFSSRGPGPGPRFGAGSPQGTRPLTQRIAGVLESIGDIHFAKENFDESAENYLEALENYRALVTLDRRNTLPQEKIASTLDKLSQVHLALDNRLDAQLSLMNSLRIRERLSQQDPANLDWQLDVADNFAKLGSAIDFDIPGANLTALSHYRKALDILENLADDPEIAERREQLILRVESSIAEVIGSQLGEL